MTSPAKSQKEYIIDQIHQNASAIKDDSSEEDLAPADIVARKFKQHAAIREKLMAQRSPDKVA